MSIFSSLNNFFLDRFYDKPFLLQQRVKAFMWVEIVLVTFVSVSVASTNITKPESAGLLYNLNNCSIIAGCIICLLLLRRGRYWIAIYIGMILPILLLGMQGYNVPTQSGKYIYMFYMMMFLVMAAIFGNKVTISFIAACITIIGIFIVHTAGSLLKPRDAMSTMINYTIVNIVIANLCFLISTIVRNSINEAESKKTEVELQLKSIREIVATGSHAVSTMTEAVGIMDSGASSFSDNAQAQASGIEEITATIEEVTATAESSENTTVQHSMMILELIESLKGMHSLVTEVRLKMSDALLIRRDLNTRMEVSQEETKRCLTAMKNAMESSRKVAEATSLINDVSDQINLLSLNASIEAARAGAQGRGFAVVADEVGKLAELTQQTAKEITTLVKQTEQEMMATGSALGNVAEANTDVIRLAEYFGTRVEEVNSISMEDLSKNEELQRDAAKVLQSSDELKISMEGVKIAIEEINKSISIINLSTQDLASGAEDISSTAKKVANSTEKLRDVLSMKMNLAGA